VKADYEEAVKLRSEINRLEAQMRSFGKSTPQDEIDKVTSSLSAARKRFGDLTSAAAVAGAGLENSLKTKMLGVSQGMTDLSRKILDVKERLRQLETIQKGYKRTYSLITSAGNDDLAVKNKIWTTEKAIDAQRNALAKLTQQQAEARFSMKNLTEEYKEFKEGSDEATEGVGEISSQIGVTIGTLFAADSIKNFIGQMVDVRSQFQAADTAIETLLGSKQKADALMSEVREYAKISPLEFSDVTAATQMMLGFNIEAEKVPQYLSAIGDVSMGNSQKFNSLTLAFSQMSAAGKLMGQDLNQMINAGFNPLQQMAETTGKSISELKKEMSDGKISAEMVQQAFIDATQEGGRFYGMSENGSKTIQGQMSMMQDAVDLAFNEMGTASEGVIMDGIQLATQLVQTYESVGKVVMAVAAVYGSFRAAMMLSLVVERQLNKERAAEVTATTGATTALTLNTLKTRLATNAQLLYRAAIDGVKNSWNAMKVAMASNPIGAIITVLTTAISLLWVFKDDTEEATEAEQKFGEEAAKTLTNINALYAVVNTATKGSQTYSQSMKELSETCEQYGIQLDKEKDLLQQVNDARTTLNYLIAQEGVERQHANNIANIQKQYEKELEDAKNEIADILGDEDGINEKAASGIITQSVDARMNELIAARQKYVEAAKSVAGNDSYKYQQRRNALYKEYTALLSEVTHASADLIVQEGLAEEVSQRQRNDIYAHITALVEKNAETRNATEAENDAYEANKRAAESLHELSDAQRVMARRAQAAKRSVSDLSGEIETLIKNYGYNIIDFEVRLKTDGLPQWMKDYLNLGSGKKSTQADLDKAKERQLYYKQQAEDMKNKGVGKRTFNAGKANETKMSLQDVLYQSYAYGQAAEQIQANLDKQNDKGNKPPKTTTNKNKGKGGKSAAELQAESDRKIADETRKWEEKQEKERTKYNEQAEQTRIDQIKDSGEKEREQRELDHNKALQDIADEAEEIKKANVEHAKALFDADSKNKGKDFYKSSEYTAANQLTGEQQTYIGNLTASENAKYAQQLEEEKKAGEEAMNDFLKQYGTYQQKRLAIAQEYTKKIQEAQTEGERLSLQKEMEKSLSDLDTSEFKKSINWEAVFGDLAKQATTSLSFNLQRIQADFASRKDSGELSTDDIKTYQEAIEKMRAEIESRDPFGALKSSFKEIAAAQKEYNEAVAAQQQAHGQLYAAQGQYDSAQLNMNFVNNRVEQGLTTTDSVEYTNAVNMLTQAKQRLAAATENAASADNRAVSAINRQKKAYSEFSSNLGAVSKSVGSVGKAAAGLASVFDESVGKAIEDAVGIMDTMVGAVQTVVDAVETIGKKTAETVGQTAEDVSDGISTSSEAAGQAVSATEKASMVLAIISAALQVATAIFSLFKKEDYMKKALEDIKEVNEGIADMRYEARLASEDKDGVFGEDAWAKASTAAELYIEKLKEFKRTLDEIENRKEYNLFNWLNGGDLIETFDSIADSVANMKVQVRHGTWFRSAKYATLKDLGLDFLDENGEVDWDALIEFRDNSDYYDKLSDANKEYIDNALDAYEKYKDALSEMRDYLSDIFGDLGSTITDALTDAFRNGTDAAETMADSIAEMLETLGQQMAYSALLAPYLDKAQERLEEVMANEALSDNERYKQISAIFGTVSQEMKGAGESYSSMLEQMQDAAAAYGFDLWQPNEDTQSGESKAWEGMSQDDASELNGRFTALQITGESMSATLSLVSMKLDQTLPLMQQQALVADDTRNIIAQSYLELQGIRENTENNLKCVKQMASRLETWDSKIQSL